MPQWWPPPARTHHIGLTGVTGFGRWRRARSYVGRRHTLAREHRRPAPADQWSMWSWRWSDAGDAGSRDPRAAPHQDPAPLKPGRSCSTRPVPRVALPVLDIPGVVVGVLLPSELEQCPREEPDEVVGALPRGVDFNAGRHPRRHLDPGSPAEVADGDDMDGNVR